MSSISDKETNELFERSLKSLDPNYTQLLRIKPYDEMVGFQNIKSHKFKIRILKKILSPALKLFLKINEDYYKQKTVVDAHILNDLQEVKRSINDMEIVFDQKQYETHKLLDNFKKEIIYEIIQIGLKGKDGNPLEVVILNPEKVKRLNKINIGSGTDIKNDYINVDHRSLEGVDVVADVSALPFDENTIEEIFASHVVEHFTERKIEQILKHWYSLLIKNGKMIIIVPNIHDMASRMVRGEISWDQFRSVALGGQDYESDYHFNLFSVDSLEGLIKRVLPDSRIKINNPSRRNGEAFEVEVVVTKI